MPAVLLLELGNSREKEDVVNGMECTGDSGWYVVRVMNNNLGVVAK